MATFPTDPGIRFPFNTVPSFKTSVTAFGGKIEQRTANIASAVNSFYFTFDFLTDAQRQTILDFFIARYGAYETFNLTNPEDSNSYVVRFKKSVLEMERFEYELWRYNRIELIVITGETPAA